MLRTLLESNPPRQRRRASTAASIAIHTAVIAGAIVATASARTEPSPASRRFDEPPIYVPIPNEDPRIPEAPSQSNPQRRQASIEDWLPIDRRAIKYSLNPVPAPPTDIDPRRLLAADTSGAGGHRRPGSLVGQLVGPAPSDQPATAATVDRLAAMLAPPRPRYPDQLRAAGVTGRVVVRLVVDTLGRVEPASVVIRETSHDLFAQAVRAVLPALRFASAEAGGRKVRMLVELPFEFRLNEQRE